MDTPKPDNDRLHLPAEAADILRVTPRTLRRLTERGEIPAVRVGGRLARYRKVDVEAYISRSLTAAPTN